jgi:hypothetical protein
MAVIECPFCHHDLEIKPPDKLHIAFSLEKPIPQSYYDNLLKKDAVCQNCKRAITVFWYSPLEYFSRI